MSDHSGISWLGAPGRIPATLNPLIGCQKKSAGCAKCYAINTVWMRSHNKRMKAKFAGLVEKRNGQLVWNGKVRFWPPALELPLKARAPRDYFVDELSDVFYERVKRADQDEIFAHFALARSLGRRHRFVVLTKRPERMARYFLDPRAHARIAKRVRALAKERGLLLEPALVVPQFPWPELVLGFSAEDQATFDARWRASATLSARGWRVTASLEPLLGPVDVADALPPRDPAATAPSLAWVLVGGLSAPRKTHPGTPIAWLWGIVNQCVRASVPVHVKQLGARPVADNEKPYPISDRKGADPAEWPEELRVRQYLPEDSGDRANALWNPDRRSTP